MNRKIFSYFEIAAKTAMKGDNKRSFILGALGLRKDGAMVKSFNAPTISPDRFCHAENRLAKKLDVGATVYVARVRLDNFEFGMSKPCHNCMKALIAKKVKRIYYTISNNEYGVINF